MYLICSQLKPRPTWLLHAKWLTVASRESKGNFQQILTSSTAKLAKRVLSFAPFLLLPIGKTMKCADVGSDLKSQFADNYKTCVDKEVLQGGSSSSSGGVSPSWAQMENMDVAGKDIASGGKAFTEVSRVLGLVYVPYSTKCMRPLCCRLLCGFGYSCIIGRFCPCTIVS
jgi:hypothetical protein